MFLVNDHPVVTSTTGLILPSDVTLLGAFQVPLSNGLDFPHGLTGRYVSSNLRLYTFGYDGQMVEYSVGTLSTTAPWTEGTVTHVFTDIFQNALYGEVDDASGNPPPYTGLAQTRPSRLYWDETDSRMYWSHVVSYNLNTTTSDQCLGYSTINDVATTGTGVGILKLSAPTVYGNRWCFEMTAIPTAFADSYCGGRRLGVGSGGALSIISNSFSAGPALFAIHPPDIGGVDTDRGTITTGLTQLLYYPSGSQGVLGVASRAPRPSGFESYNGFGDGFGNDEWNWSDGFGGTTGVWVDGPSKQGYLNFTHLSAGNSNTTVLASPTPTHTVFSVQDPGNILVGDCIGVATDTTAGDSYPFCVANITAINGQEITVTNMKAATTNITDTLGIPVVGGTFLAGSFYVGGGAVASRWVNLLSCYDPADMALVADGADPRLVPYATAQKTLAGVTYPSIGIGSDIPGQVAGSWLDTAVSPYRLYVLHKNLPYPLQLVYVYEVNC